ncbi:MAG: hypothetical protein K2I00_02210 [Ruminococcus sp.]|nr:hypothetical protein [Ruminococcus sp.]
MKNENLKKGNPDTQFRSGREAVENGRKGGIASGISRNFRGAMKKRIRDNPELIDMILDALEEKACSGDLKALEMMLELVGESPRQMEIALKKKELKLREKQIENNNW